MKYIYSTSQMSKLSLTLCTFSVTGLVASLFLTTLSLVKKSYQTLDIRDILVRQGKLDCLYCIKAHQCFVDISPCVNMFNTFFTYQLCVVSLLVASIHRRIANFLKYYLEQNSLFKPKLFTFSLRQQSVVEVVSRKV